jgi:hypothetical protein
VARAPPRCGGQDLGALQDVLLQELHVLVVDVLDVLGRETADLLALEEGLLLGGRLLALGSESAARRHGYSSSPACGPARHSSAGPSTATRRSAHRDRTGLELCLADGALHVFAGAHGEEAEHLVVLLEAQLDFGRARWPFHQVEEGVAPSVSFSIGYASFLAPGLLAHQLTAARGDEPLGLVDQADELFVGQARIGDDRQFVRSHQASLWP